MAAEGQQPAKAEDKQSTTLSHVQQTPEVAKPQQKAADPFDSARSHFKQGLAQFSECSPFLDSLGRRAAIGAMWGGAFGLVFFRSSSMRKFSVLYGAGFGLGMCAPTIIQLQKDFFAELKKTPTSEEEFERQISLIQQEITLRNKFKQ